MGASLTQIFSTEGMRGSFEVIKKFSFVGTFVQFMLSVLGLMSNVSVLLRTSATIFYLSNRSFWDSTDEVKENGQTVIKEAKGFDKLLAMVKFVLPNIKQYSDYGSAQFNLDDNDTTLTYIIRSAPSTLGIIFFSTLAFNGLLFQIYANLTDGLVAIAEQARDLKIAQTINYYFERSSDFSFTLSQTGTNKDTIRERAVKLIYMDMIDRYNITSKDSKVIIGGNLQNAVADEVGKDIEAKLQKVLGDDYKGSSSENGDTDWGNISVSVSPTNMKKENFSNSDNSFTIEATEVISNSELIDSSAAPRYLITINKSVQSNTFSAPSNTDLVNKP